MRLVSFLKTICQQAFLQAHPTLGAETTFAIELTLATKAEFGHYQCNSAMKLTKTLQQKPRDIAEKTVPSLQHMQYESLPIFEKIEVAGPGFINLTLSTAFITNIVNTQLTHPQQGVDKISSTQKAIIDFSSPNIAKEMHVGHLRSTIIGDSIARMLEFVGYETLRLNHIGDWGTQFGMLIAYLKREFPEINNNPQLKLDLPALEAHYKASKKLFDQDPTFKQQAQLEVVELQSGNQTSLAIWQQLCDISKHAYQEIYDLLEIKIIDRGESFYNSVLADVVSDLEAKQIITESDGAKCIYLDGYTNREGEPLPLIVQKSDGGYNYATTDLATIRQRVIKEKGNWLVYVTDAGQASHFAMFFKAAMKAGYYDPKQVRVDHVPFGVVLQENGKKFKTREGETIKLIDLLNTAISKASNILQTREPDISVDRLQQTAKILGLNAIKYADLSNNRTSDYVFSYDRMLQFEGNTAAFLTYAYVRVQSIKNKVNADISKLLTHNTIELTASAEIDLALILCQFSDAVHSSLENLLPNRLTDYLFKVAEKFHVFFHHCRVEGSEHQNSRLLLCEATAQVLACGFKLLGLNTLEKM